LLWQYDIQTVMSARSFSSGWFTEERLRYAARVLHKFGDFEFFIITLSIILVIIGKVRSNSYYTRVAGTLFLAGAMAGFSVQVIKFSAGRPRPSMVQQGKVEDASFTGPSLSSKYRSYPSGHSTCTATAVTVLALAFPRLLPFAVMAALLVGSSRVFHNAHYPTDVLSGLAFGMAVGGMCAAHLVRLRKRLARKGQWRGTLRQ
jgi:membrane-associated phospholipid phosphatase